MIKTIKILSVINGVIQLSLKNIFLYVLLFLFSNLQASNNHSFSNNNDTILIYAKDILIVSNIDSPQKKLSDKSTVQFSNDKIFDLAKENYSYNDDNFVILHPDMQNNLNIIQNDGKVVSLKNLASQKQTKKDNSLNSILYLSAILLIFSCIFIWFFYNKNNKNFQCHYDNFLDSLKFSNQENNQIENETNPNSNEEDEPSESKNKTFYIADDTVNHVLSKLSKFEKSKKFTNQDMSISSLSSYLDTNTKYLSEILKQYKGKKFCDYINGLRIDYITEMLYKNPVYREYKISYLAKESGFASREVFAVVFKKETGISPSYYISNLKKNNTNKEEPPINMFAIQSS